MIERERERERPPYAALRDLGYTGASRGRQWAKESKASSGPAMPPASPPPPEPKASPAPAPAAPPVAPVPALTPALLLRACEVPDHKDHYTASKVAESLGLSKGGTSALVTRAVPVYHVVRTVKPGYGQKLLTVNRVGVAYMVNHTATPTAKSLHTWAAEVIALDKACLNSSGPSGTVAAPSAPPVAPAPPAPPTPPVDLDAIRTAAALVEVAEGRVLEANTALSDALQDLSTARRTLRALLRPNLKAPDEKDNREGAEDRST